MPETCAYPTFPVDSSREQSERCRVRQRFLCSNKFQGVVPSSWANLPHLSQLSLAGNQLGGTVSAAWSQLSGLEFLDLASNELQGELPESWKLLDKLQYMRMCDNQLSILGRLSYAYMTRQRPLISTRRRVPLAQSSRLNLPPPSLLPHTRHRVTEIDRQI